MIFLTNLSGEMVDLLKLTGSVRSWLVLNVEAFGNLFTDNEMTSRSAHLCQVGLYAVALGFSYRTQQRRSQAQAPVQGS